MKHYKTYKLRKGMSFTKLSGWWWNYGHLSGGIAKFIFKKSQNLFLAAALISVTLSYSTAQDITLKLHLRGVAESKVTLLPMIGTNAIRPIAEIAGINNNETATILVSKAHLPGEFVLRFDYTEKENGSPYPCEKHILIYNQNLELWVNPMYCGNNDSTWFQKNEKENTVFTHFFEENGKRKEKLGVLQQFLMTYDDTDSKFYQQGIKEYENRRSQYNQWLTAEKDQYKALFVSHTFQFQYVPQLAFSGNEDDRIQDGLDHYFDGIDFNDSLLINTINLKEWMDGYVNIYGSLSTTAASRDSLFPLAGKTAIEKARQGHPKVYGWMVDYFYTGYESFNMTAGIKMLEPYLNDTLCLTRKRQAIGKRLKGMKTLLIGSLAPDFILDDNAGNTVLFSQYKTNPDTRGKLLLFWSADCGHCTDLVNELYPWYQQLGDSLSMPALSGVEVSKGDKKLVEVFALSLDDTDTEIAVWKNAITQLQGWKHIRCDGGINSKEANAYFILSTPVMILVDAQTNKIIATPESVQQLSEALK